MRKTHFKYYLIGFILILFMLFTIGQTTLGLTELRDFFFSFSKVSHAKMRIAACPSFHQKALALSQNYEFIPTLSTSESLALLADGKADMILSGRTLRPEEPVLDALVIREGFSFLSKEEKIISAKELVNYKVFTDLDPEILKSIFPVKEVFQVTDIYDYLDTGIVISSWENTDYNRANIVHLLQEDDSRFDFSRQPTLYCPSSCNTEQIKALVKNLEN